MRLPDPPDEKEKWEERWEELYEQFQEDAKIEQDHLRELMGDEQSV